MDLSDSCKVLTVFMHFCGIAAFSWLFLDVVVLHRNFNDITSPPSAGIRKALISTLFSYGIPLVSVGVALLTKRGDYWSTNLCWPSADNGTVWSFSGPIIFLLASQIILVFYTVYFRPPKTSVNASSAHFARLHLLKRKLLLTLITGILMGLTWLFAFLAVDNRSSNMSYAFSFFNAALAIWILIDNFFFDVEVRHRLEYTVSRNPSLLQGTKLSRSTTTLLVTNEFGPKKQWHQTATTPAGSTGGHFYPTNSRVAEDVTLMRGKSISRYTPAKALSEDGDDVVPMPSRLAEAFAGFGTTTGGGADKVDTIAETDFGVPEKTDVIVEDDQFPTLPSLAPEKSSSGFGFGSFFRRSSWMIDDNHLNESMNSGNFPRGSTQFISPNGKRPSYASFGAYYNNQSDGKKQSGFSFNFDNIPKMNGNSRTSFVFVDEESEAATEAAEAAAAAASDLPDELLFNDINPEEESIMAETNMSLRPKRDTLRSSMSYNATTPTPTTKTATPTLSGATSKMSMATLRQREEDHSLQNNQHSDFGFDNNGVMDEFVDFFESPAQAIRAAEMGLPEPSSEFTKFASPAHTIRAAEMGIANTTSWTSVGGSDVRRQSNASGSLKPKHSNRWSDNGGDDDDDDEDIALQSVWSQH